MAKHPHPIDRVLHIAVESPWAMTRPMVTLVAQVIARRVTGSEEIPAVDFQAGPTKVAPVAPGAGVLVLPLHGVMMPRATAMSDISGATAYDDVTTQLRAAVNDPKVGTIVLDVDSPGGNAQGATELAAEVLKARAVKPVIAQANFNMCSAAYWIASCATSIVAAPSASIGSIGVFNIHEDLSAALEKVGVKLTFIAAGKYKVDPNPATPLSDETRARLQARVDAIYGTFVQDVARGRGVTVDAVRAGFGEGDVVNADTALALGMVDRIGTLDDTVARALSPAPETTVARAAAATPPAHDTPQEPSPATGQDRAREVRDLQHALLGLGF
jgi:signal peptide peptidase SppA